MEREGRGRFRIMVAAAAAGMAVLLSAGGQAQAQSNCGGLLQPPCPPPAPTPTPTPTPSPAPSPAPTPTPPPPVGAIAGAVYGGGNVNGSRKLVANDGAGVVGMRVNAARTRARININLRANCGGALTRRSIAIGRDGRFDSSIRIRERRQQGTTRIALEGRLTGHTGSGTWKIDLTRPRGSRTARCSSGRRRFQLRTADAPAPTATDGAAKGAIYYGTVSQSIGTVDDGFTLRVDRSGAHVVAAIFTYFLACSPYPDFDSNEYSRRMRISRTGSFKDRYTFRDAFTNGVETYTITMAGRFVGGRVVGTASITTRFRPKRGTRLRPGTCRSGTLRFTATT